MTARRFFGLLLILIAVIAVVAALVSGLLRLLPPERPVPTVTITARR